MNIKLQNHCACKICGDIIFNVESSQFKDQYKCNVCHYSWAVHPKTKRLFSETFVILTKEMVYPTPTIGPFAITFDPYVAYKTKYVVHNDYFNDVTYLKKINMKNINQNSSYELVAKRDLIMFKSMKQIKKFATKYEVLE